MSDPHPNTVEIGNPPRSGRGRRSPRQARPFWRARRGAVAVETALAAAVLIVAFGGLAEIVREAYVADRMDRAARAAAHAVALVPQEDIRPNALDSIVCAAIRRELVLDDDFDCAARWALTVDTGLTPKDLLEPELPDPDARAGDMVAVRIAWNRAPWEVHRLVNQLSGDDSEVARQIAVGVARHEPGAEG